MYEVVFDNGAAIVKKDIDECQKYLESLNAYWLEKVIYINQYTKRGIRNATKLFFD